jgi:hypothetical protein
MQLAALNSRRSFTKEDKKKLQSDIISLDDAGQRKVLAIILYYQKEHSILPLLEPRETTAVDIGALPLGLQLCLENFCAMHHKFMKEDAWRNT